MKKLNIGNYTLIDSLANKKILRKETPPVVMISFV
jgi:hypothetical protein